ncbi:MAG TPA: energy-coupling factor transporter transmembrane component T [Victivallales bacterium]|nr:energy-coupling factor transporter transmembrane component T [Victivallales bacterium]
MKHINFIPLFKKKIKLDVRTKLLIVYAFSFFAIYYQNIKILFLLLVANIFVNFIIGANFKVRGFKAVIYFTFILMLIQSLFIRGGEPVITFMGYNLLSSVGLIYGIKILLRTYILLASALIIINSDKNEMVLGLVKLRVPYEIVFMLQLSMRFLPNFIDELKLTIYAVQLRGINLKQVYKKEVINVYLYIFTPIMYSIFQKTEKLSSTVEIRGFRYIEQRSYYKNIKINIIDYLIIILVLFISTLMLYFYSG